MVYWGPTEPMTPEGWKVLGCVVMGILLGLAALGLVFTIKSGFNNLGALALLGVGAIGAAIVGVIWYLIRRWADRI